MSGLPLEIVYQILADLPYEDILSYCDTHIAIRNICSDSKFWFSKLDREFAVSGKIPSEYARKYSHDGEDGRAIYKRWFDFTFMNLSRFTNQQIRDSIVISLINDIDIFMFKLDQGYVFGQYEKNIFLDAIMLGESLDNIKFLQTQTIFLQDIQYIIISAVKYNRIDVLNWIHDLNIITDMIKRGTDLIPIAITYDNTEVLNWIRDMGYISSRYSIISYLGVIFANKSANALRWLIENGYIFPKQSMSQLLSDNEDITILNVLDDYNLIIMDISDNTLNIYNYTKRLPILNWLVDRGYISPVHSPIYYNTNIFTN